MSNPAWTVGTDTKSLATELAGELAELNGKGYSRYYVTVRNANKKQYVRFGGNANGGSGATAPTVGKEGMTVALRSCRFSRSGYAFSGWAASAGGRVAYGARAFVKLKGDMDLYAVWKRVVPVRPVYALRAAKVPGAATVSAASAQNAAMASFSHRMMRLPISAAFLIEKVR